MGRLEKIYLGLCILFSSFLMIGNITYQKFVTLDISWIHSFELSVGALIYLITFLITDLIAEFYGLERAKWCIRFALLNNILMATVIGMMDMLPATNWSKLSNQEFHRVFGYYSVSLIGSLLACYISHQADVKIYLWIKKMTRGRMLWIRNNLSTGISLFFDTCIAIGFLSYFHVLQVEHISTLIFNSYVWKLLFTVLSTPIFYMSVYFLRWRIFELNKDAA